MAASSTDPTQPPHRELAKKILDEVLGASLADADIASLEVGVYFAAVTKATSMRVIRAWRNPQFARIYVNSLIASVSNLTNGSRLLERLKEGEFPASRIGTMTPQDMLPELWKPLIDKTMWRNEHVLEEKPAAMTDTFKCGKCKKRECAYQELQLRSADEPMTIFVTCLNCGHRWKI